MTAGPRRFRFATAAQWRAGLLSRAQLGTEGTIAPAATWAEPPARWQPSGHAAAIAPDGTIHWVGTAGELLSAEPKDEPRARPAPAAIASARHLAAGRVQLWAADERPRLHAVLRADLALRLAVVLPATRIVDLAADGRDGVWVLVEAGAQARVLHVDCAGHTVGRIDLPPALGRPGGIAYLSRVERLVLIAADRANLHWIDPSGNAPRLDTSLHGAALCPVASAIAADGDRVAVGGIGERSKTPWVATFDAQADPIGVLEPAEPPLELALGRDALLVTTASAALRYARADDAQPAARETAATFVTPALHSPPAAGRAPWLRAEALAALPAGASIELAWTATDDPSLRDAAEAILHDQTSPPLARWQRLQARLDWSAPLRFEREGDGETLAALPLHDLRASWLWIACTLVTAPGAAAPRLQSLEVLYPDASLMDSLPAIYRRQAEQPGDFLRGLVGVLETTTQGFDARIGALGSLLDPASTGERWLDAIARWLSLPWDDSLKPAAKRALLGAADTLPAQRGTRLGLETLLACVLPAGRARVIDLTADHGYARLAGDGADGARLPALLAGLPPRAMVLGSRARLGRAKLPREGEAADCGERFAGSVLVEVRASIAERREWQPWLAALIEAMTPLTARVRLRWLDPAAAAQPPVLSRELVLEPDPEARLGEGATLGRARLARGSAGRLDAAGADPGLRL